MDNGNYIKLNRKLMDHWIWKDEKFSKGQAWIDLLMRARWKDEKKLHRGKLYDRKRGEVNCSLSYLADRWGWSRDKVRRFIRLLESEGMVTLNATTNDTTITIENYSIYQDKPTTDNTTDKATDNTTDNTTDDTQKKKEKKEKKEKNTTPLTPQGEMEGIVNQLPLELRSTVHDFIDHRKKMRKPLTVKALKMMLKKLNELSSGDSRTSIEILEQSIINGWAGVFPLPKGRLQNKPRNEALEMLKRGVFDDEEGNTTNNNIFEGSLSERNSNN